jgi:hypothetical protein
MATFAIMDTSWCGQKYSYENFPDSRIICGRPITTPPKPPKYEIDGFDLPKHQQKFQLPDQEMVWTIDDKMRKIDKTGRLEVPLTDNEIAFVKSQWHKRLYGYWFFNNGYLEYITGLHWFYLSYYKIKREVSYVDMLGEPQMSWGFALPSFTDADRDHFLFWAAVVKDKKCLGMFEITNRRDGKSHRGKCTAYEISSRAKNTNSAIQSKNEKDAQNMVVELVESWNEMPMYFKPIDSGYSQPKNGIFFKPPNTLKTSGGRIISEALNSWIKPFPATAVALDGQGIGYVYQDEVGKTTEENVRDRWYITRPTLLVGTSVLGKALITTTVEEIEKQGARPCKELWDDSSITKTNKVGFTQSGLYQYFKPAYYGFWGEDETGSFIDEYGYSNMEEAKKYQLLEREGLVGSDLYAQCRKYPHTIDEAFRSANTDSIFMIDKIYDQKDFNATLPKGHIRTGMFIGDVNDLEYRWIDNAKGPFKISFMPDERERNLKVLDRGYKPQGATKGFFGTDPYDHNKPKGNRFSHGAIHGVLDWDPIAPASSGGVFLEYIHRHPVATMFYNDVIAAGVFFGMKNLIERERPGCIQYMESLKLHGYLYQTNKKDYTKNESSSIVNGINTSGVVTKEAMMSTLAEYIADYVGQIHPDVQKKAFGLDVPIDGLMGKLPFDETLEDLINFDPSDWEKFDATVSLMLAVLALYDSKKRFRPKPATTSAKQTMASIFGGFDNTGQISRRTL